MRRMEIVKIKHGYTLRRRADRGGCSSPSLRTTERVDGESATRKFSCWIRTGNGGMAAGLDEARRSLSYSCEHWTTRSLLSGRCRT